MDHPAGRGRRTDADAPLAPPGFFLKKARITAARRRVVPCSTSAEPLQVEFAGVVHERAVVGRDVHRRVGLRRDPLRAGRQAHGGERNSERGRAQMTHRSRTPRAKIGPGHLAALELGVNTAVHDNRPGLLGGRVAAALDGAHRAGRGDRRDAADGAARVSTIASLLPTVEAAASSTRT